MRCKFRLGRRRRCRRWWNSRRSLEDRRRRFPLSGRSHRHRGCKYRSLGGRKSSFRGYRNVRHHSGQEGRYSDRFGRFHRGDRRSRGSWSKFHQTHTFHCRSAGRSRYTGGRRDRRFRLCRKRSLAGRRGKFRCLNSGHHRRLRQGGWCKIRLGRSGRQSTCSLEGKRSRFRLRCRSHPRKDRRRGRNIGMYLLRRSGCGLCRKFRQRS